MAQGVNLAAQPFQGNQVAWLFRPQPAGQDAPRLRALGGSQAKEHGARFVAQRDGYTGHEHLWRAEKGELQGCHSVPV